MSVSLLLSKIYPARPRVRGEVYRDKVSRMVAFEGRKNAARLSAHVEAGKIDQVEVHSIDRLGRDVINVRQRIKRFPS